MEQTLKHLNEMSEQPTKDEFLKFKAKILSSAAIIVANSRVLIQKAVEHCSSCSTSRRQVGFSAANEVANPAHQHIQGGKDVSRVKDYNPVSHNEHFVQMSEMMCQHIPHLNQNGVGGKFTFERQTSNGIEKFCVETNPHTSPVNPRPWTFDSRQQSYSSDYYSNHGSLNSPLLSFLDNGIPNGLNRLHSSDIPQTSTPVKFSNTPHTSRDQVMSSQINNEMLGFGANGMFSSASNTGNKSFPLTKSGSYDAAEHQHQPYDVSTLHKR